jgi:hypothetical protein
MRPHSILNEGWTRMSVTQPEKVCMGVREPTCADENEAGCERADAPGHATPLKSAFEPPSSAQRCRRLAIITRAERKP